MKRTWVIVSLAILAIIPAACGAAATASDQSDNKPAEPAVTSTSKALAGDVVTIGGYTYNCITAEDGSLGIALWCDKIDPHG